MKVSQILERAKRKFDRVITASPDDFVIDCAEILSKYQVGALLVIQKGKLVGIMSERDIVVRCVAKGFPVTTTKVRTIMTEQPITVNLNDELIRCQQIMDNKNFRHLPVVDNGKVVGVISQKDVLNCLYEEYKDTAEHLRAYIG